MIPIGTVGGAIFQAYSTENVSMAQPGTGYGTSNIFFGADRSNSKYGSSSTVQPQAINVLVAIRY